MTKKAWVYIILETLLFLTIIFSLVRCNGNKIDTLEHNISTYKSEIEYITTENNELISAKQSLILTETELREELNLTKKEMKELNKKLGEKIAYISRLESQIDIKDTIYLVGDTVYITDGIVTKRFSWSDEWTSFEASVTGKNIASSDMTIDRFHIDLDLDIGLTDDYKFWAKTSNPYVSFTDINSMIIDGSTVNRKDKRLHHGITVGIGLNYGLINKTLDIGPSVIYGFTYSF